MSKAYQLSHQYWVDTQTTIIKGRTWLLIHH